MPESGTGTGRRLAFATAMVALLAAGCTTDQSTFNKAVIDPAAGSEANIGSLTTVIQRNPSDANGYNVRGTAFGQAGKLKEAIADFDTAIKLNPSFYQAYASRALVQRRLGRDDLALADYNRSLQINPSYDVAYIGRGNIYRQNKQTALALADSTRRSCSAPTTRAPITTAP